MDQESNSIEYGLLRRYDQKLVAVVLLLCIVASFAWWIIQIMRDNKLVELDKAELRAYSFKVDINLAAWPELAQIPDIGPATARKIVASRKSEGPFAKIDDLQRIHGIGPKTVERIRPYLLPFEDEPDGQ